VCSAGRLIPAGEHSAANFGSIAVARGQIAAQTGVRIGSGQLNELATANARQFFIVFRGTSATQSDHAAIGIVNAGRRLIYDPQSGQRFTNLADFGSFTAWPVKF
jgi:hypothetical protein